MASPAKMLTVLSVDGGGVRGLIPATILAYLEAELKAIDGNNGRLADYFDVVAGTSTGGTIATMIAFPDSKTGRPLYQAEDITDFYLTSCPKIFPPGTPDKGPMDPNPKYDGEEFHKILAETVKDMKMDQTLPNVNVVLTTFDIYHLQSTIFSTYEARRKPSMNALLRDVCYATSAAPMLLPPHDFTIESRTFNLVDGGIAVLNPATLLAIDEVTKEISRKNERFVNVKAMDYTKYLVLSLGAGLGLASREETAKYTAEKAKEWAQLQWAVPLPIMMTQGGADMVDIHTTSLFKTLQSEENYLRIQVDNLTGDALLMDNASEANLNNLVQIANGLLDKTVSRVNLDTGLYEEVIGGGTNKEALASFAKLLSDERKSRLAA